MLRWLQQASDYGQARHSGQALHRLLLLLLLLLLVATERTTGTAAAGSADGIWLGRGGVPLQQTHDAVHIAGLSFRFSICGAAVLWPGGSLHFNHRYHPRSTVAQARQVMTAVWQLTS
jgi:hypothetical protein